MIFTHMNEVRKYLGSSSSFPRLVLYTESYFAKRIHHTDFKVQKTRSNSILIDMIHSVKSAHIRSFSGPYFPAFRLSIQS